MAAKVNEAALKHARRAGRRAARRQRVSQVVLGPVADQVAGEIRDALRAGQAQRRWKGRPAMTRACLAEALARRSRQRARPRPAVPGRLLLKLADRMPSTSRASRTSACAEIRGTGRVVVAG